jgi:hypothetical protein
VNVSGKFSGKTCLLKGRFPGITSLPERLGLQEMEIKWTDEQEAILGADPGSRIVVDAGPGTGKTAVACGRVARLVDHYGQEPSNIMVISFTRTAVAEIRERISSFLEDAGAVFSIRIATLDSFAWTLHSGFREDLPLFDYNDNIREVAELAQNDEGVKEYLKSIEHLVVDEAQDIVGLRAELVEKIIENLSPDCGVTVFCDMAQAIYGFANDEETSSETRQETLGEHLLKSGKWGFEFKEISEVKRVHSPNLKHLFSDTRKKVLDSYRVASPQSWKDLKGEIRENADGLIETYINEVSELPENAFLLFRRRVEVLLCSSFLGNRPHRIRMSGLPICIAPWVGACLSGCTGSGITRNNFLALWRSNVSCAFAGSLNSDEAWRMLVRLAGETESKVNLTLLRTRLGRKQPPVEFCLPDLGSGGPIIATIHAAKGRESNQVFLMPPPNCGNGNGDTGEEIRVLYVGATRARESLTVGEGFWQRVQYLEKSKRIFHLHDQDHAQVEIGRDCDVTAANLVSKNKLKEGEADEIQDNLKEFAGDFLEARAISEPSKDYIYEIEVSGKCLGFLSNENVNRDMFEVGNVLQKKFHGRKRKPPQKIEHLRIMGVRTVVLPPDSPVLGDIHEPWASSGILLAPVVLGYPKCYFPFARRRY